MCLPPGIGSTCAQFITVPLASEEDVRYRVIGCAYIWYLASVVP